MIKYLGSKRRLVPVLGDLVERAAAGTALDLFTGTTRVAQEWKRRGVHVTAVDLARYAGVLAACYVETDARQVDRAELDGALSHLQHLPGVEGYVTATFSRDARFFQEENARRIDAIRHAIDRDWCDHALRPVLLTALIQAADRVDSTTGIQMAYLKQWSARSYQPLTLRPPPLLDGPGRAICGDATQVVATLPPVDLAYLDPPYNQHRYLGNYHVWETLVAWDAPAHYGVACKRVEVRDGPRSVFNERRRAPGALAAIIAEVQAGVIVVSCSDEGWTGVRDVVDMARGRGAVRVLAFESPRYVGARIGIHNPAGQKVGQVGRTTNVEYLVLAGPADVVDRMAAGYRQVEPA